MAKIEVKNVYKIFGTEPMDVLPIVKEGATKEDVLEETGLTITFGYKAWRIVLRYVAPVLVAGVFIGYFI